MPVGDAGGAMKRRENANETWRKSVGEQKGESERGACHTDLHNLQESLRFWVPFVSLLRFM
jgi:hypothetical protein